MSRAAAALSVAVFLSAFQTSATAAPIVAADSLYSVYLAGEGFSDQTVLGPLTFDGAAESFVRSGLDLTVGEDQTELGGGRHGLGIQVTANGDLFPLPGAAILGVGQFGGAVDFVAPVRLLGAFIELYAGTTLIFRSTNYALDYGLDPRVQFDPWNGQLLFDNGVLAIGNAGGRGIDRVRFEFEVQEVPEPGALTLLLTALPGAALVRRRRWQA